jgi:predicted nuclease with TOPRIM domain
MSEDIQRDLGRMEAELSSLKRSMDELRDDVKAIRTCFHEMQGGTRTLLGVATVIGSVSTLVVNYFMGKH